MVPKMPNVSSVVLPARYVAAIVTRCGPAGRYQGDAHQRQQGASKSARAYSSAADYSRISASSSDSPPSL